MKAYIFASKGKPWNTECQSAYDGFRNLGIECRLFYSAEELDNANSDDIVVGGLMITEYWFSKFGISIPNYNYPVELEDFLGRKIQTLRLKDLPYETFPIFVKPLKEKAADGMILKNADDIDSYHFLDENSRFLCSEVVNFISEWRCFVRYGQIIGIQPYKGDFNATCAFSVIKESVRLYKNAPSAYALDFGVTSDGRTLLVEMNDGFSIGSYGLSPENYAKFLSARWCQIINASDPLSD